MNTSGCYEMGHATLAIEICQLTRKQDLTQNNPLETHCLSSLCCISDYDEVVVNLIQLTCRSKYVSWKVSWINYKNTSSNIFPEISSFLLLGCFTLLNYVLYLFFYYVIHHENPPKIKLKHSLELFKLYNPKVIESFRFII